MLPCTGIAERAVQTACFSLREIPREGVLRERATRTVAGELANLGRYIGSVQHLVEGATGVLESCNPKKPLDPDGALALRLEEAERFFEETVEDPESWLVKKPVTRSCSSIATALRRLHDATVRLRWAIMEHDADLSKASRKTFDASNIEGLIADLRS